MTTTSRWIVGTLVLTLTLFHSSYATPNQTPQEMPTTISKAQLDSLSRAIDDLRMRLSLSDRSLEVLEQTNQQLSLWWNPYGLLISVLGILFALLAIAATLILFR